MDKVLQAQAVLANLALDEEQAQSLDFLVEQALKANRASAKQFKFLVDMAVAGGSTLAQELDNHGYDYHGDPRNIDPKFASKLISEFIRNGWKAKLTY